MKTVPNIISTKDLSYLEDMLNWNFIVLKKINHYINESKDEDIINMFDKCYNELLNNYNDILCVLE